MEDNFKWSDNLAKPLAEFLTSTLFVILVMLSFMGGIVGHLAEVFHSWFLAIGFQCVVLIASVNSGILPTFKLKNAELPVFAIIMSFFMFIFVGKNMGAVEQAQAGDWSEFIFSLLIAFCMSAMELMFSYLFNTRWTVDLKRFAGIKTDFQKDVAEQVKEEKIAQIEQEKAERIARLEMMKDEKEYKRLESEIIESPISQTIEEKEVETVENFVSEVSEVSEELEEIDEYRPVEEIEITSDDIKIPEFPKDVYIKEGEGIARYENGDIADDGLDELNSVENTETMEEKIERLQKIATNN